MPRVNIFDSEENLPSHFTLAKRVSIVDFLKAGGKLNREALQKFIDKHCVQEGQPLIIGHMDKLSAWDDDLFNVDRLTQVYPTDRIDLFNMKTRDTFKKHTMGDFIKELDPKHPTKLVPVKSRYKKQARMVRQKQDDAEVPVIKDAWTRPEIPATPVEAEQLANTDTPVKREQRARRDPLQGQEQRASKPTDIKKKQPIKNIYYAKDLTCPSKYKAKINELLPDFLLPLGPSDLFSSMPEHLRAENLMCYVGSDKTGTALHRDICGTMGHNLMSYGEEGAFAEWYFIENQHREALLSTFHARKNDRFVLDDLAERERSENRKSSFVESDRVWVGRMPLKKAGFKTKLALQRPGDLVIIPSMCYHQVRNVKTSVKIAWNRATAHTLQLALEYQLPIYQSLGRPEVYRCKAMVFYTLQRYRERVCMLTHRSTRNNDTNRLLEDCRILMRLLGKDVIYPETIECIPQEDVLDDAIRTEKEDGHRLYTIVCDFCSADIFNRHYRCVDCNDYDLCMSCYSQGRGCEHLDRLSMYQSNQSADNYYKFYLSFLNHANQLLIMAGFDLIENTIPERSNKYSLATTCRRIEMHRKANLILSNYMMCGHCQEIFTLSKLYSQYGLDPHAIFSRRRCSKLPEDQNNIRFTCVACTSNCDGCVDMPVATKDIAERVYYLSPQHDPRNWGGPADVGVYNTAHWPDRRNELINRKDAQIQWTQDDLLGRIRGSIIASMDPSVLKRSLAKKETSKQLAEAIMHASNRWSKTVVLDGEHPMELRPSETVYIEELKDLGVPESITATMPECKLSISRKRQRDEDARFRKKWIL